jgi:hypothetical protein
VDRAEKPHEGSADALNVRAGGGRLRDVVRLLPVTLLGLGILTLAPSFLAGPNQADLGWTPFVGLSMLLMASYAVMVGLGIAARGGPPVAVAAGTAPEPLIGLRVELGLLGGTLATFAFAVGVGVLQHLPLGWDESVYALITRHWLFGTPATGWGFHRPLVLSILAVVPELVSRDESVLRVVGLLFGCLAVGATWLLGRRLHGPISGLLAAVVVASAQPIQVDAGFLLNDIPAVSLLLILTTVLWHQMEVERPGWSMLWLAPIAALAFYVRYGASVPILLIAATSLLIWWRRIASDWPRVLATAALLFVLLLPHLVFATLQTGTPWGIGLAASGGARPTYPGEGLVTYLAWFPYHLLGPLGAVVALIGLLTSLMAITRAIHTRAWDRTTRALTLLLVPAVGQIVVLGMSILPQSRYIYFAMVLLVLAGAIGLARAWSALGESRRLVGWLAGGLLAAYLVGSVVLVPGVVRAQRAGDEWIRHGARLIASRSGADCSVLASDAPQITWYSGCAAYNFRTRTAADRDQLLTGRDRWLVVRRDGEFQPRPAILNQYLSRVAPGSPILLRDASGAVRAELYRFAASGR